jgi:hypothetical protein
VSDTYLHFEERKPYKAEREAIMPKKNNFERSITNGSRSAHGKRKQGDRGKESETQNLLIKKIKQLVLLTPLNYQ